MPGEPLQRALFVQNVLFLPSTHRRRILKRGPLDQHGQIVVERIVSAQHLARAPAWIDVIDAVTVIEQAVGTTPRSGAYRHQLSPHSNGFITGFLRQPKPDNYRQLYAGTARIASLRHAVVLSIPNSQHTSLS